MNNLEKYVWKDRRLTADRNEKQIEYKMINLNELQLNVAYNQCKQMLYNQDVKNPGRMAVLDNIQKQLVYCNAELAVRYFKTLKDKRVPIYSTITPTVSKILKSKDIIITSY